MNSSYNFNQIGGIQFYSELSLQHGETIDATGQIEYFAISRFFPNFDGMHSAASRIERARFDGRGRVQTAYVTRLWASALRLLNSSERPTAATASSAVLFTFCFFCKRWHVV